jgi:L-ascorbate metabolism protein UlaG (beta-lactamase superfamily)
MRIHWYGHSAFLIEGRRRVFIDPFGPLPAGFPGRLDLPPITGVSADLLLITHEHPDHNNAAAIGGDPHVVRSTPGSHTTPLGHVVAIASEHDPVAGTALGANTLFRFELDGVRICHLGDLGQSDLRHEQRAALGAVDVLLTPVGGEGATIDGPTAARLARELGASWVIPMHYRSEGVDFVGPIEPFLEAVGSARRLSVPWVDLPVRGSLAGGMATLVPAVPAEPRAATAAVA